MTRHLFSLGQRILIFKTIFCEFQETSPIFKLRDMIMSFLIHSTDHRFLSSRHSYGIKLKLFHNKMMFQELIVGLPKKLFENLDTFKVHTLQNKISLFLFCFCFFELYKMSELLIVSKFLLIKPSSSKSSCIFSLAFLLASNVLPLLLQTSETL